MVLTDARRNVGTALLVAAGAAVAGETSDAVLARTLTGRVVAGLAGGANRVAFAGYKYKERWREGEDGGREQRN